MSDDTKVECCPECGCNLSLSGECKNLACIEYDHEDESWFFEEN